MHLTDEEFEELKKLQNMINSSSQNYGDKRRISDLCITGEQLDIINEALEELCDLMCGDPEEDFKFEHYDEKLAKIDDINKSYILSKKINKIIREVKD